MNKFMFLNPSEINKLINELMDAQQQGKSYKLEFCEVNETEVIESEFNENKEVIPFTEFLPTMENHLHISIAGYDVTELEDSGVGYLFHLQ